MEEHAVLLKRAERFGSDLHRLWQSLTASLSVPFAVRFGNLRIRWQ